EMVVDAALAHAFESVFDRLEKAWIVGTKSRTPQHFENGGLRKLWCAAQAAVDRIEHIADLHRGRSELLYANRDLAGRACLVGESRKQDRTILFDPVRLFTKQPRNFTQYIDEGRTAEARIFREICAAPYGLGLRREKHGQRPAALLAEKVERIHID